MDDGKPLVEVKVWGRYACFTRPENKVERLSYPIITPSAAVGVLESIYWKPQFRWEVTRIGVLPHPERNGRSDWENYMPITLNEIVPETKEHPTEQWINFEGFDAETGEWESGSNRIQRTCLILRWPCYRIQARARLLSNTTNLAKIRECFERRVKQGKCHQQPYLGLREFGAYFDEVDASTDIPIAVLNTRQGMVTHSCVLPAGSKRARYRFVPLDLAEGWLQVERPRTAR